ncbi:MAG: hypothetical protein Q9160_008637 [Pyrenula sp. 1 TL-2023]
MASSDTDATVNHSVQRWLHQRKSEKEDGKCEAVHGSKELSPDVGFANNIINVIGKTSMLVPAQDSSIESLEDLLARARPAFDISDTEGETTESEGSDDQISRIESNDAQVFYRRCLQPLKHYVTMLMEICPTLEAIYRLKHQAGRRRLPERPITVSSAALPYVTNVRDKFPQAAQELVDRLGEANWQRYERLRAINSGDTEAATIEDPKSKFRPASLFKDSALGSSLRHESEKAVSIASHSSFASSNDGDKSRARVPKMPVGSDWGKPFLCPFCKKLVDIHTRVAWKLHIYSDLQAYMCTSKECPESLALFTTRKGWVQHEIDHHLSSLIYRCPRCEDIIDTKDELLHHMEESHDTVIENFRSAILAKAQVIEQRPASDAECQLCHQTSFTNNREYATHVGKHLEEIALIALPRADDSDDSDDESSDTGDSDEAEPTIENKRPPSQSLANVRDPLVLAETKPSVPNINVGNSYLRPPPEVTEENPPFSPLPPFSSTIPRFPEITPSQAPSDREHKCPYCSTTFKRHHNLKSHLLTHSQEKPYVCPICDSRFRRLHDLKRHTKLHTGERPHVCNKCGRRFARGDALNRHQNGPGGCGNSLETIVNSYSESHFRDLDTHLKALPDGKCACTKCGRHFDGEDAFRNHLNGLGDCASQISTSETAGEVSSFDSSGSVSKAVLQRRLDNLNDWDVIEVEPRNKHEIRRHKSENKTETEYLPARGSLYRQYEEDRRQKGEEDPVIVYASPTRSQHKEQR